MSYEQYFSKFWQQYQSEVPAVKRIYELFLQRGEQISFMDHDHLALRTFAEPRVNIDIMMQPFVEAGYQFCMDYDFPEKKLYAKHYEPPQPGAPKIFISELLINEFSTDLQNIVHTIIDHIPNNTKQLFLAGACWGELEYATYEKLLAESQYAAWLYAYGFRTNHFAFSVNKLKTFDSCAEINSFLKSEGFRINQENGEVKGGVEELLEQSSTMADTAIVRFKDGEHEIPSCYYEFAKRFPDEHGELFKGFVPSSADKIFESTDKK